MVAARFRPTPDPLLGPLACELSPRPPPRALEPSPPGAYRWQGGGGGGWGVLFGAVGRIEVGRGVGGLGGGARLAARIGRARGVRGSARGCGPARIRCAGGACRGAGGWWLASRSWIAAGGLW